MSNALMTEFDGLMLTPQELSPMQAAYHEGSEMVIAAMAEGGEVMP